MKSISYRLGCAILASVIYVYGAGCTKAAQTVYPADTVVVVNGMAITEQGFKDETIKREISAKMLPKIMQLDSSAQNPTAGTLKILGLGADQLSEDQKRYITSIERNYPDKPITQNAIFNHLVRQAVLYQEAVKQGYIVSNEEAQEILRQVNEASNQANDSDPTAQKIMVELNTVMNEYGFASQDDYLNWNLPNTSRSMAIQRMQNKFDEKMAAQYSELSMFPLRIAQYNAWEDYTEFRLRAAEVEIKQGNYVLEYYGKPWEMGGLDLKG